MAYGHPYNSQQEITIRSLLCYGDTETAQQLLRRPEANVMIDIPLRTVTQLRAIRDLYGLSNINIPSVRDMCKPLEAIDTLVITEVKRRSSLNWRLLLFITRLLAKRPKQRIIAFENITTDQRFYANICSTRQRLIEQIFDRLILPLKAASFEGLMGAQFSSGPLGSKRQILQGDIIPKSWDMIYIRLLPKTDPLASAFANIAL
jgi:hypothetical protein